MISFYFGDNEYQFPESWEELTPEQYLSLLPYLQQFSAGELSVNEVRTLWFMDIAGLNGTNLNNASVNTFTENVYLMAREFRFMFAIEYKQGSLDNISSEIRKDLRKYLPHELEQTTEVRLAAKLKSQFKIDACWCANLVPGITVGENTLRGYTLELNEQLFTTSLVAAQFNDAIEALNGYATTHKLKYLHMLTAILYSPTPYSSDTATGLLNSISDIPSSTLDGVLLNFQAFLAFLGTKTKWRLLWNRKSDNTSKLSLGMSESLYNLSTRGYGNYSKVDQMPLTKFLDLMLKDIYDTVRLLHSHDKDVAEIAAETGLSIHQVKQIV